jgi:acyl-CoA reductase-like NAD-dependent aldehyde dehydrogenase
VLSYVLNEDPKDFAVAQELVQHPAVQGVGFTGSIKGGTALVELANARPRPIPVFAEMGSTNPVIATTRASETRGAEIGHQLADAVLARHGQQCTCPGVLFFEDLADVDAVWAVRPASDRLRMPWSLKGDHPIVNTIRDRLSKAPSRNMLAPWVRDAYMKRLSEAAAVPGVEVLVRGPAPSGDRDAPVALLITSLPVFASHKTLQDEIFGPALLVVNSARDVSGIPSLAPNDITRSHSLTYSIYFDPSEGTPDSGTGWMSYWVDLASRAGGRIIFNGPPTGVRVAHGMVHSGPFPACNRPDTTAVGPFAIERWCRPVCFQNAPQELLPEELRDDNPRGIARFEDGVWVPGRPATASGS